MSSTLVDSQLYCNTRTLSCTQHFICVVAHFVDNFFIQYLAILVSFKHDKMLAHNQTTMIFCSITLLLYKNSTNIQYFFYSLSIR